MNSKEEKIKEAYGEYWERTKDYINENGWLKIIHAFQINVFDNNFWEYSDPSLYRPKSLQGIENNNGWIKIESEDDLPKDYDSLYDVCNNQNVDTIPMTLHQVKYLYDNKKITHYQKHNKKLPALY